MTNQTIEVPTYSGDTSIEINNFINDYGWDCSDLNVLIEVNDDNNQVQLDSGLTKQIAYDSSVSTLTLALTTTNFKSYATLDVYLKGTDGVNLS